MLKGLFISSCLYDENFGGAKVSLRNLESFSSIVDITDLIYFSNLNKQFNVKLGMSKNFPRYENKLKTLKESLRGNVNNMTNYIQNEILNIIYKNNYDMIFIDSSFYGKLCREIKRRFPEKTLVVFFHNIERDFFKSKMKVEGIKIYPAYVSVRYNEKLSAKYADKIINLSSRDSNLLKKYYKREADMIFPVTLRDEFEKKELLATPLNKKMVLLFVGSYFHGNVHGIEWFINNVLSYVDAKLLVVGKGMEKLSHKYDDKNIEIIGEVDDVKPYYYMSDIVISPIFYGAGMKVKIAEALMYGKTILGTIEAFEGYEIDFNKVGRICNTIEEFKDAIYSYKRNRERLNITSRKEFENKYSTEKKIREFKDILVN